MNSSDHTTSFNLISCNILVTTVPSVFVARHHPLDKKEKMAKTSPAEIAVFQSDEMITVVIKGAGKPSHSDDIDHLVAQLRTALIDDTIACCRAAGTHPLPFRQPSSDDDAKDEPFARNHSTPPAKRQRDVERSIVLHNPLAEMYMPYAACEETGLPAIEWDNAMIGKFLRPFELQCSCGATQDFWENNGPFTTVYSSLRNMLRWNARKTTKKTAGFTALTGPPGPKASPTESVCDGLANAVVWAQGCSDVESCTPYTGGETSCQWWPVLVRPWSPGWSPVDGCYHDDLMYYYCPAMAINGSRPWNIHRSRVWLVARARL